MSALLGKYAPQIYAILRIVAGLLFAVHGSQKLFGFPIALPAGAEGPVILIAGIIEFFGGSHKMNKQGMWPFHCTF